MRKSVVSVKEETEDARMFESCDVFKDIEAK